MSDQDKNDVYRVQLTNILIDEFTKRQASGKMNRNVERFWKKIKKRFDQNLVKNVEFFSDKAETKTELEDALRERFKSQVFLLHTAIFLDSYETGSTPRFLQ